MATAAPTAEIVSLGVSEQGRPAEVIALGEAEPDAAGRTRDQRPALLIVAGLQADHAVGRDTARALADRLLAEHAALLTTHTVYILPDANPDGSARWSQDGRPGSDMGRAPQTMDADRDGRTNEDPGDDLNGDGLITMMRVPAPHRDWGLQPTHLIDPDDPRLMRPAKPADGESATHALLIEGRDNDADGAFNEDGWGGAAGGGVDLDRHFPIHWPEHTDGAGLYPLARQEARTLVEWAQGRGNIVAVLVYGPHDTLASVPPAGQFPPPGRVPSGIEEGDKDYHERISALFKEITGVTKAADGPSRNGSFLQWAYADLGVFTFGTPVWYRPDLVKAGSDAGDREPAPESEPAQDPREADRLSLLSRGVPAEIVAFIMMSPEERATEMAAFSQRPPEEQAAMMSQVQSLPADVQQRVVALAQGGADPGPPPAADRAEAADRPAPRRARARGDSDDARWLAWIDEREIDGFVAWQPYDHPQLGPVEIGGFVPGVRVNPPQDQAAALVDQQVGFVAGLLERLPDLAVDPPAVTRVGDGLWRVELTARNTGLLPTVSAIGRKTRRLPPLVMAFDPAGSIADHRLVSGSRIERVDSLEGSGASATAAWLVAAGEGTEFKLEVRSPRFGDRSFTVRLGAGAEGGAP